MYHFLEYPVGHFLVILRRFFRLLNPGPGYDEDGAVAAEASLMKAEALFQLGNFETSAIWFHRHARARGGASVCQTDLQE